MKAKAEYTIFQDVALFALRLIIASVFLFAAYGKWAYLATEPEGLVPFMAHVLTFLVIIEPIGALALIFGYLTRWASAGLSIIMVGAILMLRFTMGVPFFTQPQAIGWDYNLLLLGGCIVLLAFGAGKWSLDFRKNMVHKVKIK